MEFSKHNWATISETICPEMLIFGKWASSTLFFQNILKNPIISEILFYDVITLVLYGDGIRNIDQWAQETFLAVPILALKHTYQLGIDQDVTQKDLVLTGTTLQ